MRPSLRRTAFAIPGDHRQRTGGFIYERRLLEELRSLGRVVDHIVLPAAYPSPSADDEAEATRLLGAIPADRPLILDGLVFGAIATDILAGLACPVVAMLHHPLGLETGLPHDRARMLLERETANLRLAAHVVVPSAYTAGVLVRDFGADPARITVAPPGLDGPRGRARTPTEPPLILAVGLLARRKGYDVLIRALARLSDLPWAAVIVGKTHEAAVRDELAALIAKHGLGGRIELAGELDDDALAQLTERAGLFALATRYEGYGMALAEAMASGLPIVTTWAGAVPGTVGDAAFMVAPDDPPGFAAALRRVLTDRVLRDDIAQRSLARGLGLPAWRDTAAIVGRVLDGLT